MYDKTLCKIEQTVAHLYVNCKNNFKYKVFLLEKKIAHFWQKRYEHFEQVLLQWIITPLSKKFYTHSIHMISFLALYLFEWPPIEHNRDQTPASCDKWRL